MSESLSMPNGISPSQAPGEQCHPLFGLLKRLDEGRTHYTLSRQRPDSVTVTVKLVDERTEIHVFLDGHMEVLRFLGTGDVLGGAELVAKLLRDKQPPEALYHVPEPKDRTDSVLRSLFRT